MVIKGWKWVPAIFILLAANAAIAWGVYRLSAAKDIEKGFAVLSKKQFLQVPYTGVSVNNPADNSFSFVEAARIATNSVVYIRTVVPGQKYYDPFFGMFGNMGPTSGSGSGVIYSSDGYIITNNHVIQDAQNIEVYLNGSKRKYAAKLIGTDKNSDLALIKIDATGLAAINFTDSDLLPVGEWVLAIGNPFNLNSTATAGIISAKGRNINLVQSEFPIESFIQTDAAINPGNSGGALVDLKGNLVGINTAIYSKTGSYSGYGFAIPSNIVAKIISDIRRTGSVQIGVVEAEWIDIDDDVARSIGASASTEGVFVSRVYGGGNADKAGLRVGDIITAIETAASKKIQVKDRSTLDEQLAYDRPGDIIVLYVQRKSGEQLKLKIKLTNTLGNTSGKNAEVVTSQRFSADLVDLPDYDRRRLNIKGNAVKVVNIREGYFKQIGIFEGFVILTVNGNAVGSAEDFVRYLNVARGQVILSGVGTDGHKSTFSFYIN